MALLLIETGIALLKKVILGEHIHILAHEYTHTTAGEKKIYKVYGGHQTPQRSSMKDSCALNRDNM